MYTYSSTYVYIHGYLDGMDISGEECVAGVEGIEGFVL
jgi:hypothetical protein